MVALLMQSYFYMHLNHSALPEKASTLSVLFSVKSVSRRNKSALQMKSPSVDKKKKDLISSKPQCFDFI